MSALDGFFTPASVVAIGVSARQGKLGRMLAENLIQGTPEVYFVNPGVTEILGRSCYSDVAALPAVPTLAVIAVPAPSVLAVLTECGRKGIRNALVLSAGFGETGAQGMALQREVVAVAHTYEIRMLGPNSSGLYNCTTGFSASIGYPRPPGAGRISFVTQSGASVLALTEYAVDHGLRLAKLVDCGNQTDVTAAELVQYLATDEETGVLGVYLEGAANNGELLRALESLRGHKRVVLSAVGRTEAGLRAAGAHTATMARVSPTFDVQTRTAGGLYGGTLGDVMDLMKAVDWQPLPRGRRVGVVGASGGMSVELTDLCAEEALAIPLLSPEESSRLLPLIPAFATPQNPIDMGPIYSEFPTAYAGAIEILFASPSIDLIIAIIADRGARHVEALEAIRYTVQRCQEGASIPKPVYVCWASTRDAWANAAILESAGIPCFSQTERTTRIAGAICRYAQGFWHKEGVSGAPPS